MDKRKAILDVLNSDSTSMRYSYMMLEKLVMIMLNDYITRQNKEFFPNYFSEDRRFEYDGYAPDGFDNFIGSTIIELKIFRSSRISTNMIFDTIRRIAMHGAKFQNLLFIIVGEIPQVVRNKINEEQQNLGFKVVLWDTNDLIRIFNKNEDLFINTYNNLNTVFLKDTISKGISHNILTYVEKRSKYIEQLNNEYNNDKMVLFLGAGASRDAKIATWDILISELFVTLIDKELNENGIEIDKKARTKIIKEIINQNGYSPLLQTRFLRNGFEDEFEKLVSEILYKNALETSELLEEIAQMCVHVRDKVGIQAVVNYNFDDLVERNLERLRVKYRSIYGEGMITNNDELGIFHVHGFLPHNKDGYENLAKSLLVFSEEGYHKLLLEPYNWANITQLNYLINNTCLFIGLSMTDPNMRRLLEIAAQKGMDGDNNSKHYAIMKRFNVKGNKVLQDIQRFEIVNESLQESFYKELGINVLWIDEYNEIPMILRKIKGKS